MDDSPNTVTEAIEMLRELGYSDDFELVGDELRSERGSSRCPVEAAVVAMARLLASSQCVDPIDTMWVIPSPMATHEWRHLPCS